MNNNQALEDHYTAALGGAVESTRIENGTVLVYVAAGDLHNALTTLRDDSGTAYDNLSMMTAADYSPRQPRFELAYELYSTRHKHRVRVKVKLEHHGGEYELPEIDSVADIYLTANWHERECYDLFGINFRGHPDLRRIVLPEGWDGYPLRKEYPYDGKRAWKLGTSVDSGARSDVHLGLEQT